MAESNDAIKFLADIQSTQKGLRSVAFISLAVAAVVCVVSVFISLTFARQASSEVYVLDQGAAMEASRMKNDVQKDLEVINHVTRFHELFFNIAPNVTAMNQNISRAMELADESAYRYFNDLKEERYFSQLININATQQVSVDSVKVDVGSYPYRAVAYLSLYVLRESTVTLYSMRSQCELTNVPRTVKNTNGLMMHKFFATKPELVETRDR